MAGERTLPGLGLTAFWDLGSEYKTGMDTNLRALSALVQATAKSRATDLPAIPTLGDIYIVQASDATYGAANANKLAVWDGPAGTEAWVFITPVEGWMCYIEDEATHYRFDGTAWAEFAASGGGLTDAPSDGTLYGRKDGTWVLVPAGGGTDTGYAVFAASYLTDVNTTLSTSAYATKGQSFVLQSARNLFRVRADLDTGQTVRLVVAKLSEVNPGTITEILYKSAPQAILARDIHEFAIEGGLSLAEGDTVAVMFTRTDGTATSPMTVPFASSVPDPDPAGYFGAGAAIRYASADPVAPDATYFDAGAVVAMTLDSVDPLAMNLLGGGLTDAPSDGTLYARQDGTWVLVPAGGGGLTDAPSDGTLYARQDGTWVLVPAGGGGALEDIVGVSINRATLGPSDTGRPVVYDQVQDALILSPSGFNPAVLGGGQGVIHEILDLNTVGSFTLDEASHDLDQYDEILCIFDGASSRFDVELSADGGVTPADLNRFWRGAGTGASSFEQVVWGPSADAANSQGVIRITNHADPDTPTVIESWGGSTAAESQWMHATSALAQKHNAITFIHSASGTFTTGRFWAIGIKKSRQPLEYAGRLSSAWTAGATVAAVPTLGVRFTAGVVGSVRLDAAPGADTTFSVKDGTGTVVATGTVLAGATSGDIVAAADGTVTDTVVLEATGVPGAAAQVDMVVRGEIA